MHREDLREGKEAKGITYSSKVKGAVIEVKTFWKEHDSLYLPIQKHTNRVITLTRFPAPPLIGDAVITNLRNVEIGVRTADCVPLVLIGKEWAGVVHAGWKGLASGILEKTIERLAIHEPPERLFAFIAPAAKSCCYEVGKEFKNFFPGYLIHREGKLFMDMQEAAMKELKALGVNNIGLIDKCTICSPELPSYRREGTDKRMLTSVRLL